MDAGKPVTGADIPAVPGLVIGTASCNVFRPWTQNSIAMAFAEKGAAAFAGFVYSPEGGYLVGCYDGLPFGGTYPGFPIGRVVQLQNQSAMQAFAALPYYLLLGDPRIALNDRPAWSIVEDRVSDGARRVVLGDAPRGFLPVRIPGGAEYSFIEAAGTGVARAYGFYNSRLQARGFGADLFVLVDHPGGPLTLRLRRLTPGGWLAGAMIVDALDTVLVFLPASLESGLIMLLVGCLALTVALLRGRAGRILVVGAIAGLLAALLHAGWVWTRLGQVTVTSKVLRFNPMAIAGTFLLTGAAAILFAQAKTGRGRATAALLAALPAWLPAIFQFAVLAIANYLIFLPRIEASVYNYHLPLTAACAATLLIGLIYPFFPIPVRFPWLHAGHKGKDRSISES